MALMLVVVCGVPGVGKTSVAKYATEQLDGELLRTDVVRKELFDDPEYTDEEGRIVYGELLDRAEEVLVADGVAVLDGTFHARTFREQAVATAERAGVDHRVLEVTCDPATARDRIRAREGDASDATIEIHDMFRDTFEPLAVEHATVDNSGTLSATERQVDDLLGTTQTVTEEPTSQGPAP